jgi:TolB protein
MILTAAVFLSLHAGHAAAPGCCALPGPRPQAATPMREWPASIARERESGERRLRNIRQLTFGGQNAEAYWSPDGRWLTWQSTQPGFPDEQIFVMRADGTGRTLMSTGLGRTTCSYFSPDMRWLYYSSTHERNEGPQAPVDMSQGYVWRVNPDFALYRQRLGKKPNEKGAPAPERVLFKPGYVAETTIAPDGKTMVFTGDFEGEIDIYRADLDGKNVRRIKSAPGYDGGPFVGWNSRTVVYRRGPFESPEDEAAYRELHAKNLVRPRRMDLWIMDIEGRYDRQVTRLPGASFAPFLHPDGRRIIFCSNHHDPKGREFDLFLVNKDGTGLEQVTFSGEFDGFPMFTRDGKRLVWASNRHGTVRGETNVFVADWVD